MEFKLQLPKAIKLFLLLFSLFWIFTWNLPTDSDLSCEESCTSCKEKEFRDASSSRSDVFSIEIAMDESYDPIAYDTKKFDKSLSPSGILIPSFNEWREMEMAKHEKSLAKDRISHQYRKLIRRKLNYASSKCGAKILTSNPEARHRLAVLSEKSDEYFLNPCRVRTWFVIELCDSVEATQKVALPKYASSKCGAKILTSNPEARHRLAVLSEKLDEYFLNPCRVRTWFVIELCDSVEATQVELANYELYSSSPKEFSVFLSDVYPTLLWHHLGTFVAEDKRTMQTFNVNEKNMGKFIKVIIHSHHGKEHYCPLSVIRVLGYSMVETLEDIEHEENNIDSDSGIPSEVNSVKRSPSKFQNISKKEHSNTFTKNVYRKYFCVKLLTHCSNLSNINVKHHCSNKPACRFLSEVMKISDVNCLQYYCPIYPASFLISSNSSSVEKLQTNSSNLSQLETEKLKSNYNGYLDVNDIIKDYEHKKSLRIKEESEVHTLAKLKENDEFSNNKRTIDSNSLDSLDSNKANYLYNKIKRTSKTKCMLCNKDNSENGELREKKENFVLELEENGDKIDSAGLINKESVLFKLSAKIKTSETDLNLINKYLQQLSQSYRHQIEDMKTRLNKTFQTMSKTSGKTTEVNAKQEQSINNLKGKIEVLNRKINFLMKGKNELTKRVIELHGFFLLLEIIIIVTVFNIFLNIFNKRNASYDSLTLNYSI